MIDERSDDSEDADDADAAGHVRRNRSRGPMLDHDNGMRVPKTGEVVANTLRRRIVNGELAIGERLPSEEELTEVFGIARTTLREALRILESQGLVEIRRGRGGGPVVTMPDEQTLARGMAVLLQLRHTTVGDLDEARQLIEPRLAAALAARHDPAEVEALRDAVEAASLAAEADDRRAFASAAARVHETIVERGGNTTLATISMLLHELVEQYYVSSVGHTDQDMMRKAVRSYRKLIRLVESGAVEATEEHWRRQMGFTVERHLRERPLQLFD